MSNIKYGTQDVAVVMYQDGNTSYYPAQVKYNSSVVYNRSGSWSGTDLWYNQNIVGYITCSRGGSTLVPGNTIYNADILTFYASANNGYTVSPTVYTHTVNFADKITSASASIIAYGFFSVSPAATMRQYEYQYPSSTDMPHVIWRLNKGISSTGYATVNYYTSSGGATSATFNPRASSSSVINTNSAYSITRALPVNSNWTNGQTATFAASSGSTQTVIDSPDLYYTGTTYTTPSNYIEFWGSTSLQSASANYQRLRTTMHAMSAHATTTVSASLTVSAIIQDDLGDTRSVSAATTMSITSHGVDSSKTFDSSNINHEYGFPYSSIVSATCTVTINGYTYTHTLV